MKKLPVGEDFLHYIWRLKKLHSNKFVTTKGRSVEILDYGVYNKESGPDFFNARILMDGQVWAGNIEMHLSSRDWYKHRHQYDRAYDNVILHVTYDADCEVFIEDHDREMPTIALKGSIPRSYIENYQKLLSGSRERIPCAHLIHSVGSETIQLMKYRLVAERLERKSAIIQEIYAFTKFNWEETLYIMVSRYFGAKVNVQPFEMLARSIPLNLVIRNKDRPDVLEAIFFGQAGMLSADYQDDYFISLKREYEYQKIKYALQPMDPRVWKFGKIRPIHFPTVRIALLTKFLTQMQGLFSLFLSSQNGLTARTVFDVVAGTYWDTHYHFGEESSFNPKRIGNDLADVILLNAVIPVLFHHGIVHQDESLRLRALEAGLALKPESNAAVRLWKSLGVTAENAFDSQALLQLLQYHCKEFRCLSCSIGNSIMQASHGKSKITGIQKEAEIKMLPEMPK